MAKQTLTTNKVLFDTIRDLKKVANKNGANVFKAVAEKLSAPASQRPEVNLTRVEKFVADGETVIVPGKLLGNGQISKKVTVVAFSASESAVQKIEAAKGKVISIQEYISGKPAWELYDLDADPGEQKNLSEEKPEILEKLMKELHDWRNRIHAQMPQAK